MLSTSPRALPDRPARCGADPALLQICHDASGDLLLHQEPQDSSLIELFSPCTRSTLVCRSCHSWIGDEMLRQAATIGYHRSGLASAMPLARNLIRGPDYLQVQALFGSSVLEPRTAAFCPGTSDRKPLAAGGPSGSEPG